MNIRAFFVLWVATLAVGFSQEPDRASDKQALRALAVRYEAAINDGSFADLKDSAAPEISAVFMTGAEVKGIDEMQKYYDEIKTKIGSGGSYSVKLLPDDTNFHGNIAVAHGASDESVVLGTGKHINYQSHWTVVLEKVEGKWKALRLHVSIDPINNPFVAMRVAASKWINLGIGALVGLVVAWLIMKLKSKRSCCKV